LARRCCIAGEEPIELTGTYSRPVEEEMEEREEEVRGPGTYTIDAGVLTLPVSWIGRKVTVRLLSDR
jgi:hypothetical protein